MTMLGVALHRSIKLWLQPAGQSPCSMYERTSDLIRLKRNARVYEKRGLYEQASIYLNTTKTAVKTEPQYVLHIVQTF